MGNGHEIGIVVRSAGRRRPGIGVEDCARGAIGENTTERAPRKISASIAGHPSAEELHVVNLVRGGPTGHEVAVMGTLRQ